MNLKKSLNRTGQGQLQPAIHPSAHPSVRLSVHSSLHPFVLSIHSSLCPFVSLSVPLSVHLTLYPFVCLAIPLSVLHPNLPSDLVKFLTISDNSGHFSLPHLQLPLVSQHGVLMLYPTFLIELGF